MLLREGAPTPFIPQVEEIYGTAKDQGDGRRRGQSDTLSADGKGALKTCVSAKRTGLGMDDFYVEQLIRQWVRMREPKIPIRLVWNGIKTATGRLPYNQSEPRLSNMGTIPMIDGTPKRALTGGAGLLDFAREVSPGNWRSISAFDWAAKKLTREGLRTWL
jgi:hypothetical protein